jgi:hypothetical protein
LLDDWLPRYEFGEAHSVIVLAARDQVFMALREVTPLEIPMLRLLFAVRSLPHLLSRSGRTALRRTEPLLDQMLAEGFLMLDESDDEVVLGVVGQFWKMRGRPVPLRDASEFKSYSQDDCAKAAVNFRLQEAAPAGFVLTTETRVTVPNTEARRRFAAYWGVIRPGSSIIRRSWLRAVKRRAETHESST